MKTKLWKMPLLLLGLSFFSACTMGPEGTTGKTVAGKSKATLNDPVAKVALRGYGTVSGTSRTTAAGRILAVV